MLRFPPRAALAVVLLTLLTAAPAAADRVTVDFESGPALDTPVTTEYLRSAFVGFRRGEGYRPYRRADARAHSGTTVADVGADLCQREVDDAIECEFPLGGTTGRLTRSASTIAVHAGLFRDGGQPVTVELRAFRADGRAAASGAPVVLDADGFDAVATVTSAAADIASFEVRLGGRGALGAAVGIDDLILEYPEGSLPDVSLSVAPQEVTIPQGGSVDVPIAIGRMNGSRGPLDLSATRLTQGVSAQFLPDPVPGGETAATLRLSATDAAPTLPRGAGRTVVIAADPGGDGGVAPGVRTIGIAARVASPFTLAAGRAGRAEVPDCAVESYPLRIERDLDFRGPVTLTATNVPAEVTASFDRSEIPAQGGLIQEAELRLQGGIAPAPSTTVTVEARSPGAPTRTLDVEVVRARLRGSLVAPASRVLTTPQLLRPGTEARLSGTGFCPGTVVRVGQEHGEAPGTVSPDGRSLTFTTPRTATSGPIVVVGPNGLVSTVLETPTVRSFRTTHALRFPNFPFDGLSFDELLDAFGADDVLLTVDLCPIVSCKVTLPIVDPSAAIVWPVLSDQLRATRGHCFGFSLATQRWFANPVTLNAFSAPQRFAYSIPAKTKALSDHLDVLHALQFSTEFMTAWLRRSHDLGANVERIRAALANGSLPQVQLVEGDGGHVVVAYDLSERPDGRVDVHVYDSELPFLDEERTSGDMHRIRETEGGVITVSADRTAWRMRDWEGGGDELSVFRANAVAVDPSMPGIGDLPHLLSAVLLGSADGSARIAGRPAGSDYLPLTEPGPDAGSAGVVFAKDGAAPSATVRGVKPGRYRQAVLAEQVLSSVEAPTAKGVRDTTSGAAAGDGLTFAAAAGAPARTVTMRVASAGGRPSRGAAVTTGSSGGGGETVRLAGGSALRFTHRGAPTSASFTLTATGADGGPATFASGPLRVGSGDTITATPVRWSSLERVRVTVRDRRGVTRSRLLRNRLRPAARVTIASLRTRASGRGAGRDRAVVAVAKVRLRGLPASVPAAGAIVLRATLGGRTLARRTVTLRRARDGVRTVRWTLPAGARGRGATLVASATVVTGGARPATVRRSRSMPLTPP